MTRNPGLALTVAALLPVACFAALRLIVAVFSQASWRPLPLGFGVVLTALSLLYSLPLGAVGHTLLRKNRLSGLAAGRSFKPPFQLEAR